MQKIIKMYSREVFAPQRIWFFVIVVLTGALRASTAHAAPPTLRVVTDENYPPYLFRAPDGRPQGYLVDLWKLWEKKTGVPVDLEPMQWAAAQTEMRDKRADVIDMIFQTPAREHLYRFSPPYSTQKVGIYVDHTINGIHDIDSLRGFQVGVERGDACIDKLHSLGIDNLRVYPNYASILAAAQSGLIKMFCMDDDPANYYLYRNRRQLQFGKAFTLYIGYFHWAVRQGDDVTFALVSQGMNRITPQERDALHRKWFTYPIEFKSYIRIAVIAVLGALGTLVFSAIWIWSLRGAVRSKTVELRRKNDTLEKQARELLVQHAQLRTIIESSPDALWLKDHDGSYIDFNAKASELSGHSREELIGRTTEETAPDPALAAKLRELDQRAWVTGLAQRAEFSMTGPDGSKRDLDLIKVPISGPEGPLTRVLGVARDITERKRAEHELRIAAVAFEGQDAIVICDAQNVIQRVNTAFTALTGYLAGEAIGHTPSALLRSNVHDTEFYEELDDAVARETNWTGPLWNRKKDGTLFLAHVTVSAVRDEQGNLLHIVQSLHDRTAETTANERAERLTKYDLLTGLPNRSMLERHITETTMRTSAENACCGALLLIGLDDFAVINNAYDHKIGDRLLQEIARRIGSLIPPDATLARFGGDVFALHTNRLERNPVAAAEESSRIASEIRCSVAQPYAMERATIRCSASIGISLDVGRSRSVDAFFKEAEIAMRKAKETGKNAICLFQDQMQKDIDARNAVVNDLSEAIGSEQFVLYYQPQVRRNGDVASAEALLRWKHPKRGTVLPSEFIPVAEQTGLIQPLGEWVMRETCRQLADWSAMSVAQEIGVAINVSARQFRQADFVRQLESVLVASAADPRRLKLEITESMVMDDVDDAVAKLDELSRLGLRISLDDFGTGNSSLSYLTRLPLHQIKIDKSFVRKLPHSRNDALVTQSIVAMAHSLELEVVAEGVETEEQYQFLKTLGCDLYQGYLFAEPLAKEEFEAALTRGFGPRAEANC